MTDTQSQHMNSLKYLILERRVQITLPRKHVNEEARGKYGHIVDLIECDANPEYCPVVETDDGETYTCKPSALEVERTPHLKRANDTMENIIDAMEAKINEALAVSAIEEDGVSFEQALSKTRGILTDALKLPE
jgi:hypothetical protein